MNNKSTANDGKKNEKMKNLGTWEIEFKKGSTEIERIKVLSEVEKYMIGLLIQNLALSVTDSGNDRISIGVSVGFGNAGGDAVLVPPPPPGGPHIDLRGISPVIKNISALKGEK
jgi:hypothetical protein